MKYQTITRDNVQQLVHEFYAQVREDDVLGPVFFLALGGDWTAHLEKLTEFWSMVVLGTRNFQGNVFGTHMRLEEIEPEHFERWLGLFEQTVRRLFEAPQAEEFLVVANRIASSLQLGYFGKVVHTV
jgi:hemoglobin